MLAGTLYRKGPDGNKVANYAQWRSREDFEVMLGKPKPRVHMAAAGSLATPSSRRLYEVAFSHGLVEPLARGTPSGKPSGMPPSESRPPAVRASDAEREAVVDQLRAAAGEGRLTLDELADRLEGALAAVTRSELEPLTADLPEGSAPAPTPGKARRWIVGFMGGGDHRGRWRVASRCTVVNVMGGADLDLTDAIVAGPETEIRIFSLMGGSDIVVPDGVHVELSGFAFMGGNDFEGEGAPPPPPGAPVVRVRAYSIMGGTDVKQRTAGSRRSRFPGSPPPPALPPGGY